MKAPMNRQGADEREGCSGLRRLGGLFGLMSRLIRTL
jgi:hypothetical protein